MKLLHHIDDFVLAWIERASHWFQRLTGWDALIQARICFGAAGVGTLLELIRRITVQHKNPNWADYLPLVACIGIATFGNLGDRAIREDAERGLRNKRKIEPMYSICRLLYLLLSIPSLPISIVLGNWADLLVTGGWSLGLYLDCCDPLPPSKGKIREWISSLRPAPALQPEGVST